jgi:hypothetical protein
LYTNVIQKAGVIQKKQWRKKLKRGGLSGLQIGMEGPATKNL